MPPPRCARRRAGGPSGPRVRGDLLSLGAPADASARAGGRGPADAHGHRAGRGRGARVPQALFTLRSSASGRRSRPAGRPAAARGLRRRGPLRAAESFFVAIRSAWKTSVAGWWRRPPPTRAASTARSRSRVVASGARARASTSLRARRPAPGSSAPSRKRLAMLSRRARTQDLRCGDGAAPVHAHVERRLGCGRLRETEAALRGVELVRRDAQIEQHAVDARRVQGAQHRGQLSKGGADQGHPVAEGKQAQPRRLERVVIHVESDQTPVGCAAFEDGGRVASASQRAVHDDGARVKRQELERFRNQDGPVCVRFGHGSTVPPAVIPSAGSPDPERCWGAPEHRTPRERFAPPSNAPPTAKRYSGDTPTSHPEEILSSGPPP